MKNDNRRLLIVGVGASAGGLAALKTFAGSLRPTQKAAFILVQHLDPNHKSILAELLARVCALRVVDAEDGMEIEADTLYIIAPDTYLKVDNGRLKVTPLPEDRGSRRAVDYLFSSLARECAPWCAGIVLSGSGSDGAAGMREIKAAHGLTLVQSLETAEHTGMPLSAIDANAVDKILAADQMFDVLETYIDNPLKIDTLQEDEQTANNMLAEVGDILKAYEGFNLAQYKTPTVQRRIVRRMGLINVASHAEYLARLRKDEQERHQLTQDLLINVTNFFRDPEAFQCIEGEAIENIVSGLSPDEEVRVWIAGCASGEEAYSLAIVLSEAIAKNRKDNSIRIFATDIDEYAIDAARRGVYPASIAEGVPSSYLKKYFIYNKADDTYKVRSQIRDLISFATQNIASDPPFGRLHLVSCRNVLIYLNRQVQERVLNAFYFSLRSGGILFLGSSESLGANSHCFKNISKKWRIYQKIEGQDRKSAYLNHLYVKGRQDESSRRKPMSIVGERNRDSILRTQHMRRSLMDAFLAPSVIIDSDAKILYIHGDWNPYMMVRSGEPTLNLIQLLAPTFRSRIRTALYKVMKSHERVSFRCAYEQEGKGEATPLYIEISPLKSDEFADVEVYGVVIKQQNPDYAAVNVTRDDEDRARQNIELELLETREELQSTIEELETSSEELKASHEESLSTNEELQSANEELEASTEELRSLNEELSTVNAQLKEKIDELQRANDDVENFFTSTDIPTVFLNPDLEVQRYTPAAELLLKMGPRDIGRHVSTLGRDLVDDDLVEECLHVLHNFQPIRKEKYTQDDRWFIRQITPYRTEDRRIDGVVLVFQNVTEIKHLSKRALAREYQQAAVAKLGMFALGDTDPEVLMQQAVRQVVHTLNADLCKILEFRPQTNDFLMVAGVGWHDGLVKKARIPSGQDSQAGYTLINQGPVIVSDLRTEKRFRGPQLLLEHNVVSGISCTINHADPPYGVIGVHSTSARQFTEDDANFLQSIANLLSSALRMKKAQEELFESELRFRDLANTIPQLAWTADETGYIQWYNQRWYDYTGTDFESMKGWGWQAVQHPDHFPRVLEKFKECVASGEEWEDEFPLLGRDGQYRWFLSRAKPIRNLQGEIIRWIGTNTDITEAREQANALRDSEQKLRLAMKTNKLGSFEYSLVKEETHWDSKIKEIWGLDEDQEPTQALFWQGVHSEDVEKVERAIADAIEVAPGNRGHYHATYRVINIKTQQLYWVEASGQVVHVDGKPVKMVGMVIDISERMALEGSLRGAVKELKATDQSRNDFLSILGHELRNPLGALSNSVELLEQKASGCSEVLKIMKHSVGTMARLLDDLLDLNRVSQNRIELDFEDLNMSAVLNNAVEGVRSACDKKHQVVNLTLPKDVYIRGDAYRVEQVFTNILLNACRYTPEHGEIAIWVSTDQNFAKAHFKDSGIGIDSTMLEKVFEPFFQIKQASKAAVGLGIGLALSKKITHLHGGKLTAYSEGRDTGSEFVVYFPLSQNQAPEVNRTKTKGLNQSLEGLKVLVVEDNEHLLGTISVLLESLGCVAQTAKSGEEGIRKVASFKPDALLVDIGLPDITGHEVAERLRRQGFEGLLVAVSGYSHKEARDISLRVGFDAHLAKPATLVEISEVLAQTHTIGDTVDGSIE